MSSLANYVTLFRLFLTPVITYVLISGHFLIAAAVIFVSAWSDLLDGYLARRYHQVTKAGMLLDPLADKLTMMIAVIYFTVQGFLPIGFVLALFFRDFSLLTGMLALLFYKKEAVVSSHIVGKISSAMNFSLIFFLCLRRVYPYFDWVTQGVFIAASVFIAVSFFGYSYRWFLMFERENI